MAALVDLGHMYPMIWGPLVVALERSRPQPRCSIGIDMGIAFCQICDEFRCLMIGELL